MIPAVLVTALAATGCGGDDPAPTPGALPEDTIEHVHGLGINPNDGAIMIATHSGLFRMTRGESSPARVGDLQQDTMGFTVVGPDRFLGSGHPDARTDDPPHLGLIASDDGGRSWRPRSLGGRADLHAIAASGDSVYGFDSVSGQLLASDDAGREWTAHDPPAPVLALAVDPARSSRVLAGTSAGVHVSADAGKTWRQIKGAPPGLVAWAQTGDAFHVDGAGAVRSSKDGVTWSERGAVGARPAAIAAAANVVLVADEQGAIYESGDGGRTFKART